MLETLKEEVLAANLELVKNGLVILTWGNASGIDRASGLVVIKPSGLSYDGMRAGDMTVVDLDGHVVEGRYKPSSDTPTHLALYRSLPVAGGIVHTHSPHATAWAQAGREIPCCGTTHADYFAGAIPCTRDMTGEEINGEYERETATVIIERFKNLHPARIPGVLVKNHGPFTWGDTPHAAALHALVLEEVARIAFITHQLNPRPAMPEALARKHFSRKHGPGAYYGQACPPPASNTNE
jgi:L-ribulose-5-phosphate 4-epimerase